MTIYKLLIVDDNPGQRQAISDSVREFNEIKKAEGISFVCEEAENIEIAQFKLKSEHFDSAIIDLVLTTTAKEAQGNEVIQYIRTNFRMPVFVVSDFPDKLNVDLQKETVVFKIKQRTNVTYKDLIDEIYLLLQSEITQLVHSLKNNIHHAMQELYWSHIAHNWDYWSKTIADGGQREKIVSRYLSSILVEKLNLIEDGFDKSNVAEMFFIPPIKSDYYTGDIIEMNREFYLIINPACDMVTRKDGKRSAENIVLLKLVSILNIPRFKEHFEKPSNSKRGEIKEFLKNKNDRYHYIPSYSKIENFLIDFEGISTVAPNYLSEHKPSRIASITEPFLKNILTRFSNYYNRLGQPDFDVEALLANLEKQIIKPK